MNYTAAAFILGIISLLFGSGSLVRMWTTGKKHAADSAVQNYRLQETEKESKENAKAIAAQATALALTNQSLNHMDLKLNKLDLIEQVHAKMEVFEKISENIFPRQEAEAKFNDLDRRVGRVEEEVSHTH